MRLVAPAPLWTLRLSAIRKWKQLIGLAQVNGMDVVHNGDERGSTETPHTLFARYDYGWQLRVCFIRCRCCRREQLHTAPKF